MKVSEKNYNDALAVISKSAAGEQMNPKNIEFANKVIDKYEAQQAYARMNDEEKAEYDKMMNIKMVISGAVSTMRLSLRAFLPKETIAKALPDDIVDTVFAFIFKPEKIIDLMNKQFDELAKDYGIPSDYLLFAAGKPSGKDFDVTVQVYSPATDSWTPLPMNLAHLVRHRRLDETMKSRILEITKPAQTKLNA